MKSLRDYLRKVMRLWPVVQDRHKDSNKVTLAGQSEEPSSFDITSGQSRPLAPLDDLPAIDEIVATTDIRAFLKPGVPESLKHAALRRAWVADPAIRDFIGIAENQWDFTNPASIPGFGTLESLQDVYHLLPRISVEEVRRDENRKDVQSESPENENSRESHPHRSDKKVVGEIKGDNNSCV
jgi:Protein of unknown function (DUF3306)